MELTWKEFKEQLEARGVKDDDKIEYIDIAPHELAEIAVHIRDGVNGRRVEVL